MLTFFPDVTSVFDSLKEARSVVGDHRIVSLISANELCSSVSAAAGLILVGSVFVFCNVFFPPFF
uniref:Uncharacterized protein n=1 Tax=Anguilla anguilla TaxID=7936 RepID=A0A0E9WVN3_ANGAN